MEILGLAGAVVVGASWMLKFIMGRLAKQDEYIKTLTMNHLAHNTQALVDMRNTLQDLASAIRERQI